MYRFDLNQKNVNSRNNLFIGDDIYYDIELPKQMGQLIGLLNRSEKIKKTRYTDFLLTSLADIIKIP
ncbi:MAG: hypothetical protein HeimC2_25120 [Candidatus Heimdallarchaeota archaeon LC_2]|nr:MAG: hypothetical protein HeimC2_25120 [Candidatus Heimdallarchaeota archaeon LC_2]